jgi:hypothetical protein
MARDLKNDSPQAIALRHAAMAWVAHKPDDFGDPDDAKGAALNRKMLRAALAYADVVGSRFFSIDQVMTVIHEAGLRKPSRRGRHA